MTNVQNEVGEIVEAITARGFTVEPSGDHHKVYYNGQVVLIEEVPGDTTSRRAVTIPSTPSDSRWRENLMAQLKRARVLDEDPKDVGQRGLTPEDEERREAERAERERKQAETEQARTAQSEQAKSRAEVAAALRERAERILGPIGVWKTVQGSGGGQPRRSIGEASRVAYAWAETSRIEPRPASAESTYMTFKKLFDAAGGLSDASANIIGRFLDELETGGADRYFELLRETLGITAGPEEDGEAVEPPAPKPPTAVEPLPTEAEDDERVRDLRERLEEVARDADARVLAAQEAYEASLTQQQEAAQAELATLEAEIETVRAQAAANGGSAKLPEIAFEALGEMIGAYVVVGEQEDLAEALRMVAEKKVAAVMLAKRIAALEMGLDPEEVTA